MNWMEQISSQCISVNFLEKSQLFVLQYTNIGKYICIMVYWHLYYSILTLLTRRCSERGTRNRHESIFRKVLTIRKRWSKDEFFMTLKLILDFLFTYIQIFLNILEYIWWSLQSSILFMGMSKRWRKVICVVKLSHRTTTQI